MDGEVQSSLISDLELAGADWSLAWPRELFMSEVTWLLSGAGSARDWRGRAELLLEEAFAGPAPRDALNDSDRRRELVARLKLAAAAVLKEQNEPRPYYSARLLGAERSRNLTEAGVRSQFARQIQDFYNRGYFDRDLPQGCVDDPNPDYVPPESLLEHLTGIEGLWPLEESKDHWSRETFFDLIEIFHDLAARPRGRTLHDFSNCGYHWNTLAIEPGQALYRWRVNRLMAQAGIPLRLAEDGEDKGRLVAVTDDARAGLEASVAQRTDAKTGDRARHALAMFRARGATEHDVRSAVLTLAGILEERRGLIKAHLLARDEGALFQIANEFAIRHQRSGQRADYDAAFLDWIFWWHLATLELTDRLLERDGQPVAEERHAQEV